MARKRPNKRDLEKERHWRALVAEWKASKLTAAAFCRQAGIRVSTFYSWVKVIAARDREVKSKQPASEEAAFVPVTVKAATSGAEMMKSVETRLERVEIWLQNGNVIRAAAMSPSAVAELLTRVNATAC